jgi:hypothetical protein
MKFANCQYYFIHNLAISDRKSWKNKITSREAATFVQDCLSRRGTSIFNLSMINESIKRCHAHSWSMLKDFNKLNWLIYCPTKFGLLQNYSTNFWSKILISSDITDIRTLLVVVDSVVVVVVHAQGHKHVWAKPWRIPIEHKKIHKTNGQRSCFIKRKII